MAKKAKQAPARAGRTQDKEDTFFRELAMVCNVAAALRKAGLWRSRWEIYKQRKRNPEFRARWEEAVDDSYAMLELEMLARSRHGENRKAPENEAERRLRELSDRQALQLLRQHKHEVKGRQPYTQRPMRGDKLRNALEKRLAEISRRLGGIG